MRDTCQEGLQCTVLLDSFTCESLMSTTILHRTQRSSSSNAVTASSQNHLCKDGAYGRRQKDMNIDVTHE